MSALNSLVSEAVDVVVHCVRTVDGPRVSSIIAVEDLATSPDGGQFTTTELFRRSAGGPLEWTESLPVRLGRSFAEAGVEIRDALPRPAKDALR